MIPKGFLLLNLLEITGIRDTFRQYWGWWNITITVYASGRNHIESTSGLSFRSDTPGDTADFFFEAGKWAILGIHRNPELGISFCTFIIVEHVATLDPSRSWLVVGSCLPERCGNLESNRTTGAASFAQPLHRRGCEVPRGRCGSWAKPVIRFWEGN